MTRIEQDRAAALEESRVSQAEAKRENAKHTCEGHVFYNHWSHPCGKSAANEYEGSWYCKTHHPPTVKAKDDARLAKSRAKWAAERDAAQAKKLAAEEQKRRADCYDDLLEALQSVWLWAENQSDAQSKGGHETFDLMMLREQRDIARAAIARATGEQP